MSGMLNPRSDEVEIWRASERVRDGREGWAMILVKCATPNAHLELARFISVHRTVSTANSIKHKFDLHSPRNICIACAVALRSRVSLLIC